MIRGVLRLVPFLAAPFWLLGPIEASLAAERPNVVFILTDDQRHDALGVANPLVHTPAMDALARRGVRFANAFVTLSICSPSRAACLTGLYGSANGVTRVGDVRLRPRAVTVAQRLAEAGYRTGLLGKWHLGDSPQQCGFQFAAYFRGNGPYYGRKMTIGGQERAIKSRTYVDDWCAGEAIGFLERRVFDQRPFFLWWCTQAPHMDHTFDWPAHDVHLAHYPLDRMPLPPSWDDTLESKPPYLREARSRRRALEYGYDRPKLLQRHIQRYLAAVTQVDEAVGRVLAALKRLGLTNNTYVFLMGDNGWFLGEHGFTSKVLPYEESIRVPLIVAGPGVRAGRTERRMALNIDLAPTILELAGVGGAGRMQGRSLAPLLRGEQAEWRTAFLYEAPEPQLGSHPLWAVRTERWKYIQTFDPEDRTRLEFEELYDLAADPHELRNVAGASEQASRRAELAGVLEALRRRAAPLEQQPPR